MQVIKTTAITLGSLFDGIGGTPLCARMCGAVCLWASEIEKFPIAVTKHHFPDMIHLGDITKINGAEIPPVDIIVGGSPCQDLSVAGQRKGMKHGDFGDEETTRSGLFMDQIRIVKEMRNATNGIQPRFMVWENVPGAFSSNNGEDFRAVLEETARIADPTVRIPRLADGWANSGSILADGFSISWRVIDAQYWGVPQRRRRIYLVADFGGQSAPQVLFEREGLSGHFAESGAQGQGTAGDAEKGVRSAGFSGKNSPSAGSVSMFEEQSPTLMSGKEGHVLCLQGNGIDRADTAGCNGKGWTEDVCYTLNTIDRPAVFAQQRSDDVAATQRACVAKQTDVDLVTYQKVTGCLDCGISKGTSNQIATNDMFIADAKTVRRLTPLECERLQGYPDNYTNIPGSSDSNRYKALGNSFAIPCALFVISGCVATKGE